MDISLRALAPELVLAAAGVTLLLADVYSRRGRLFCTIFGLAAVAAALALSFLAAGEGEAFGGQLRLDNLAMLGRLLVLGLLALVLVVSGVFLRVLPVNPAEFVSLLLFGSLGLCGVAASGHWLVLFVFLEIAAVSFATLLGAWREAEASRESSLKFFVLGAFASAFLLYGIALRFLLTGSFALGGPAPSGGTELLALFLILAGLSFKCALIPFHMWAPDVYAGGPTPVVGFLATASKSVGFIVLARILLLGEGMAQAGPVILGLAGLSMLGGSLLALTQTEVKRMMAYSGIAHAGFMAAALLAGEAEGMRILFFYMPVYSAMTFGVFAVLAGLEADGIKPERVHLAGLARRAPLPAAALAVFMFSLIGLPPTGGFVAKFLLFRGMLAAGLLWLVALGLAMSVISVGFYLRLLVPVFMEEPEDEGRVGPAAATAVAVALAVALLVAGVAPGLLMGLAGAGG